ncbi:MAG: hypothetical protein KatS3mg105_2506 [Gemmatales bacterium]|nr:MAG: hypothetical protein KatS3mg105_2506 [Gemmatales bacterium]
MRKYTAFLLSQVVLLASVGFVLPEPGEASRTTVQQVIKGRIAELVQDLDSPEFAIRERATDELIKIGAPAVPELRKALDRGPVWKPPNGFAVFWTAWPSTTVAEKSSMV